MALRRAVTDNRQPKRINMANDSEKLDGVITSPPATCWTARLETPRTDEMVFGVSNNGYDHTDGVTEGVPPDFSRRLERENNILLDFINREMKMTGSDPRIAELEKRIAALSNEKLSD
jgi:hypothetical protein